MLQAVSGLSWIQNAYNLDVLEMSNGNLFSLTHDYQYLSDSNNTKYMYYEDLMYMSHASMKMELYATAIKYFAAAIRIYNDKKCMFILNKTRCMPYNFEMVKAWYVSKHNYGLLNQSDGQFDSAVRYHFRIIPG